VFIALSVMLALGAFLLHRGTIAARAEPDAERSHGLAGGVEEASEMPRYRVTTRVGQDLAGVVPLAQFRLLADSSREDLYNDLGVDPPTVELRVDPSSEPHAFRIELEGVPVADGEIPAAHVLLNDEPVHLDLMSVPYVTGKPLLRRRQTIWVD